MTVIMRYPLFSQLLKWKVCCWAYRSLSLTLSLSFFHFLLSHSSGFQSRVFSRSFLLSQSQVNSLFLFHNHILPLSRLLLPIFSFSLSLALIHTLAHARNHPNTYAPQHTHQHTHTHSHAHASSHTHTHTHMGTGCLYGKSWREKDRQGNSNEEFLCSVSM